jgi:exopolysaccharide biosynthesis polyprenyl glycosylphosphotransferase
MLKERDSAIRRAVILVDGAVVAAAFGLAFIVRRGIAPGTLNWLLPQSGRILSEPELSFERYLALLVLALPVWLLMLGWNGMYRSMRLRRFPEILWIVLKSTLAAFVILGTVLFLEKQIFVSRMFFGLFVGLTGGLLLAEKAALYLVMHFVRRQGFNTRSVLIVGTGRRAANFIRRIRRHPEWGFRILGTLEDEPGRGVRSVAQTPVIGSTADLPRLLHENAVDEVAFVVPRSRLDALAEPLRACEIEGVPAAVAVDLFDTRLARPTLTDLGGWPLLRFRTTVAEEWQLIVKRLMDAAIAGAALVVLGPFLLLTGALIKLTSPGPALFRQERLGLHGRRFTLYKFRTMRQGAQDVLNDVGSVAEMDTPEFRCRKTGWITPVGRILRKLSIDELPQLVNVLIGQMSLIGPRPTVPEEVSKYEAWQRRRFSMKPGSPACGRSWAGTGSASRTGCGWICSIWTTGPCGWT